MQRVSFALSALDVRMVEPVKGLDGLNVPEWLSGTTFPKVPVLRLFGVSRQGASVCIHVHGCWPFLYVELSEEAAEALTSRPSSASQGRPCTETLATTEEIAEPAKLAAAIEDAARLGRSQARAVKVVNLKLERWRSIYGLRAARAFLRVEVLDFRDVEPVAAALQRGE
ncbi:unnamed protein product, partial [Effrenium voratum]